MPARTHGGATGSPSPPTWPGDVFDQAIADFAAAYADQNQQDYDALVQAVKSGRLPAETGL